MRVMSSLPTKAPVLIALPESYPRLLAAHVDAGVIYEDKPRLYAVENAVKFPVI